MKFINLIRTGALGLSLTACGAVSSLVDSVSSSSSAALTESGGTLLKQVRLITGDFSAKNNSAECIALRTKVFAKRKTVQLSAEWKTVTDTAEFTTLSGHEKQFYDAGCKPETAGASQACTDLNAQLQKDATALGGTPQWKTLDNNSDWSELQNEYTKAQSIDCLP